MGRSEGAGVDSAGGRTGIVSDARSGGKYDAVSRMVPFTGTFAPAAGDWRNTVPGGWKELVSRSTVARRCIPFSTERASGRAIPVRSGTSSGIEAVGGGAAAAVIGGGSTGVGSAAVSIGCMAVGTVSGT
jgi:hypothetical protein